MSIMAGIITMAGMDITITTGVGDNT